MDNDQTVFQSPVLKEKPNEQELNVSSPLASQPQEPSAAETPNSQGYQNAQQPPAATPPSPEPTQLGSIDDYQSGNTFSMVKKVVKILIGLFVVMLVVMVIFTIVLPIFTKNSSGKVTLTYWGLWEDSKIMQGVISDFERQNPNITINYSKEDVKQYRERLLTRINNGSGPDIFRFHNSWYPMLSGVLLALPSDTISKDEFNQAFYPIAQKDLIRNGGIYGIPLEIDTLSLFINSQLFQSAGLEPPTTWNDFINDARTVTVKDTNGKIKTAGAAVGTYSNITHAPDIISLLLLQNGVDLKNLQGASDRVEGALTFYTSFVTDQNNVWDNTLDPSILAFSKGDLAMYFGYSWDYFTIKQANPGLSFQIVPVPQLPNQSVTLASYWAEGVSVKSKHQKEALIFIKFLARKDTEEKLFAEEAKTRTFGEPYARIDLADTLKANPIIYPFVFQASDASSSFFVDSTYDDGLNQQSNTYLENAVNAILAGGSPQSAFDTFSKGVSQVLQKYGQ